MGAAVDLDAAHLPVAEIGAEFEAAQDREWLWLSGRCWPVPEVDGTATLGVPQIELMEMFWRV